MSLIRKIPLLTLCAAALAGLAYLALREPVQLVAAAPVQHGPLEASFTEEGKTRIKQRYLIAAPIAGTLQRITLQPGDAVQQGQTVAEIAPATATLLDARSRQQAQGEIRSAQAALAAAQQRTAAAQAADHLARADLTRLTPLQAAGAASREQYDQAHARAATTRAELAAARADERNAQERIRIAQAQLIEGATAPSSPQATPTLSITAPISGHILRRPHESTTPIAAGEPLMEIGDLSSLEIEAEVLSSDAVQLREGMAARILRWGGAHTLHAQVRRIEPGGFTKTSALGVQEQRTRVILDFTSAPEQWATLGDAYRVEVQFITQHKDQALQVPGNALFRHRDGWAVYRVEQGRARLTPVELGMRSATHAEITQGLADGEQVILQPDDQITEGSRLRVSQANVP